MEFRHAVAQRLKELCNQQKLSAYDLSNRSTVSRTAITDLLNAKYKRPNGGRILELCIALKISVFDFYNTPYFKKKDIDI